MNPAQLTIVEVFPSLLQPEGDHGNSVVLAHRARARGVAARIVVVHPGDSLPDDAEVYLLGGSQDVDIAECARRLRAGGELSRAVESGAVVLGVGAGFSILGHHFTSDDGAQHAGVGLLDVVIERDSLAAGPVVTLAHEAWGLPALSGYEYHRGRARLGPEIEPFVALEQGVGNGSEPAFDGAVTQRVIGTWLHGPLLPRNPEVADLLLRWAGVDPIPLDDALAGVVRTNRMREARSAQR